MAKQASPNRAANKTNAPGKKTAPRTRAVKKPTSRSSPSNNRKRKGFFITLEGGEGSGKSTQMKRLAEFFRERGRKVVTTREPGGSPGAEAVRHVLLSGAAEPLGAEMEAILFAASRGDHVDTVIEPALERDEIVISDRFFDSTRVYQGVGGNVSSDFVLRLEKIACRDIWPDLTIIFDLDPKEGMKRAGNRRGANETPDRFEKEALKQQELRRKAYLDIARKEPDRCIVIDASGDEDAVFKRVRSAVLGRLENPAPKTSVPKKKPAKTNGQKLKMLSHKKLTAKRKASKTEAMTSPATSGGKSD